MYVDISTKKGLRWNRVFYVSCFGRLCIEIKGIKSMTFHCGVWCGAKASCQRGLGHQGEIWLIVGAVWGKFWMLGGFRCIVTCT